MSDDYTDTKHRAQCPHCGGLINVAFKARLEALSDGGPEPDWEEELDAVDAGLLAQARQTGVLAAFEDAVPRIFKGTTPRNVPRFFLTFLHRAQPIPVRREDLDLLRLNLSIKGKLTVHNFNSVGVVVDGSIVRAFIPILGKSARSATALKSAMDTNLHLGTWLRSRFGYVSGTGAFSMAMRERSIGDFARLVQ